MRKYPQLTLQEEIGEYLFSSQIAIGIENFFDASAYLFSIDRDRNYFTNEPLEKGLTDEDITKGNFRLNKLLHLVNILHYTKEDKGFSEGNFLALPHGAVVKEIYYQLDKNHEFRSSLERKSNLYSSQPPFSNFYNEKEKIVRKVFNRFKQYSDKQLVLFSKEDPAWETAWKDGKKYLIIDEKIIKFYQKFYKHVLEEIDYFDYYY